MSQSGVFTTATMQVDGRLEKMKLCTSFLNASTSFMFVAFKKTNCIIKRSPTTWSCNPQDLHAGAFMPWAEKRPKDKYSRHDLSNVCPKHK